MTADRQVFKKDVTACLGKDDGVAALLDRVAGHFPNLEVFRENDDLVVIHGERFMIIRPVDKDHFRTAQYSGAPTTSEVDLGRGKTRDVDGLFDAIVAFAGV